MKNTAKIAFKLLAASSLICVIGFGFLILNPDKEHELVKNADADIYMLDGIEDRNQFKKAVESMGIKARAYDFNGNIMYFGNTRIHDSRSAAETANLVQEQLVFSGVNKKNYIDHNPILSLKAPKNVLTEAQEAKAQEYRDAMLAGEVVPTRKSNDVIEMSGIMGIKSMDSFNKRIAEIPKSQLKGTSLSDFVEGYRYIEVRQNKGSRTAEIIAVWSEDDKFDPKKLANTSNDQSAPDPKIPSCMGCKRIRRVQALDKNEPYNINKWVTSSNVSETYRFYERAMLNRGWTTSHKQSKINKLARALPEVAGITGKGLSLEKNGEIIEITILPTKNGGAQVFSMEQYMDSQPTLKKLPQPNNGLRDKIRNWLD